jgi:hypothetical protein
MTTEQKPAADAAEDPSLLPEADAAAPQPGEPLGKKPRKRTTADDVPITTAHGLSLATKRGARLMGDY